MTATGDPHYLLNAIVHCRAGNGRRIPWSPPLIDALVASPLTGKGWTKKSNISFQLKIPFEGADPATAEEDFINQIKTIESTTSITKGISEIRVNFQCNTCVVYDQLPIVGKPKDKDKPKVKPKDNIPLTAIDLKRRTAIV